MYKGSAVHVIPSVNLGEAYAALSMLDYSLDSPEEVENNFTDSMNSVECGMVSRAVRDAEYTDIPVKSSDYIGFVGKKILSADPDRNASLFALCDSMGIGDHEIATVIFGADVSDEDRERTSSLFEKRYPGMEFYAIDGKQDIYDFIVVLE